MNGNKWIWSCFDMSINNLSDLDDPLVIYQDIDGKII